ncbi:hypothetical protein Peur_015151 [Populus x canadensis]
MIYVARLCLAHSSCRRPTMKTVNFLISLHINKLHSDFEAQLYVLNSTFIILCSRSRLDFFLIGDGLDFDSCLLGKKSFDTIFFIFLVSQGAYVN